MERDSNLESRLKRFGELQISIEEAEKRLKPGDPVLTTLKRQKLRMRSKIRELERLRR